MKKQLVVLLLLITILLSCAHVKPEEVVGAVYSIEFRNNSDKTMVYLLFWLDHDFYNYAFSANMAGGELAPGGSSTTSAPEGKYYVTWIEIAPNRIYHKPRFFIHSSDTVLVYESG